MHEALTVKRSVACAVYSPCIFAVAQLASEVPY